MAASAVAGARPQSHSSPHLGSSRLRARRKKSVRREAPETLFARLSEHVTLKAHTDGKLFACFGAHSVGVGMFTEDAADRAKGLRAGLPIASFASGHRKNDKDVDLLVRRLARLGLLEFGLRHSPSDEGDQVVIEPQVSDYWPRPARLRDTDVVVLSRFAYLRRRGAEMVLESPRAAAVFTIRDPQIAVALVTLTTPQQAKRLRRLNGVVSANLLALLIDCRIAFKVSATGDLGRRSAEGDDQLVLWDFHDLLFHARSTEGRHANPLGGLAPYANAIAPLPALRPRWPGQMIDLGGQADSYSLPASPFATLLNKRRSTREFDPLRPITLGELARFLAASAGVLSTAKGAMNGNGPDIEYTHRPYPSAGASYELELYLGVNNCDGLARGFYHYDAGAHGLVPIDVGAEEFNGLLTGAQFAMAAPAAPQILITITARFGRVSWKYSSIAYSLILKDVGVLLQTFYLMAADMDLGGCAIGITNIELFAGMTGIEFHVEGPVGQFALGRGANPESGFR